MATLNSSNITDGNTVEPNDLLQLYDAFTSGGGTTGAYSVSISGSLTGSASTATSASYAVTASYAANAGSGIVTQINSQGYSIQGSEPVSANFKFYAGTVKISGGSGITPNFAGLAGKTLGTNVWVTATIEGQASTFPSDIVTVRSLAANGTLTIETNSVPDATAVHFHVIYVP